MEASKKKRALSRSTGITNEKSHTKTQKPRPMTCAQPVYGFQITLHTQPKTSESDSDYTLRESIGRVVDSGDFNSKKIRCWGRDGDVDSTGVIKQGRR